MEAILTGIVEIIFYYIFGFPGALIRWIFSKGKTLKEVYKENLYLNGFIGTGFISIIIALIVYFGQTSIDQSEIDTRLDRIQTEIESISDIYSMAIDDSENGLGEAEIITKYQKSILSGYENLNNRLEEFGEYCKRNGVSESEYKSFLGRIDNIELKEQSEKLSNYGINFFESSPK